MPKLNAPAEIHWRRSNMNTRDPILMKSVEVLKDCRSLNTAAEMNCPMPRSVEKVPIRNEKRCSPKRLRDDRFATNFDCARYHIYDDSASHKSAVCTGHELFRPLKLAKTCRYTRIRD